MSMKSASLKWLALALLPASLLAFNACSTPGGDETVVALETADGAAIVDTIRATATVNAIDAAKRRVGLTLADGHRTTVKCGPEVANFNQLAIGDRVNLRITEELAIYLGTGNPPASAGAAAIALAPLGSKPGVVMADTVQVTARIAAIDAKKRRVTLSFADGSTRVLKVGKAADLSRVRPGDDITVQHTEAIAVTVEKP